MPCRLFGTKPLSQSMLPYCQLEEEQNSLKFKLKITTNLFNRIRFKMSSTVWCLLCLRLNAVIVSHPPTSIIAHLLSPRNSKYIVRHLSRVSWLSIIFSNNVWHASAYCSILLIRIKYASMFIGGKYGQGQFEGLWNTCNTCDDIKNQGLYSLKWRHCAARQQRPRLI